MTFLALALAALALGAACAWAALGADRAANALAAFALLGALGWAAVELAEPSLARDLTVLHEGGSARTLDAIYGLDQHAGWLWRDAARSPVRRAGELPVAALLRVNLALASLSAAALAVLAAVATGRPVAAAVALLLLASSRGFWNGALSETPAPAVWFAMASAVPAWSILDDAHKRPPQHHLLALASIAASGALAAGVRAEFAIYAAPFALLAVAVFVAGAPALDPAWALVRGALARMLRAPWPLRLAVAFGLLAFTGLSPYLDFHARLWLAAAAPTLAPRAPVALLTVTPAPAAALALLGCVRLAQGGAARALFAAATAGLFGVYLVASHGVGWEMLRYGAMGAMGVWLAAVAGWLALEDVAAARAWHPAWRSSLAMVPLFFVPGPGSVDPSGPGWWDADARGRPRPWLRLADQTHQREARIVVQALTEAPDCLFVARARRSGDPHGAMELVTFGRGRAPRPAPAGATVRSLRAGSRRCVHYVRTLDCDLLGPASAACADDLRGAVEEFAVRERAALYSDPGEYGAHAPEVRYGVWRVEP